MSRTRVLLAGDFPERPPMTVGGIQAVTWQLASGLAGIGEFDIHAVACERFWRVPPRRRWRSNWGGCTAHYLRTPRLLPHVVSSWTSDAEYVRHEIRATRAQLVHAHGQVGYTIGAIRSGLPHVVTPHGMLLHEKHAPAGAGAFSCDRLRQTLWSATEAWCLAHAKHMVVISPYVRKLIAPRTNAQLHDIPNPVDPSFMALERTAATEQAESSAPVLLSVGWLNARKRQELIVRALPLVRERVPGARLRIVGNVEAGDAQQSEQLRKLVAELGVGEAVEILSGLSHDELLQEYRQASVYVHAAVEESSPMAVAQAMAAGVALCAVDIPGLHHLLVEGSTGIYAHEATPCALADAIVKIINNPWLAQMLGAKARKQAQARFHPSVVASATADLYRAVLVEARR
ncbi:MAG TPA: glycosyltransferase family 4 protein [Solirubrobacteraceae bacterium]|jgi:glycosyltransferase involved in cell wall biosynthesis